MNSADAKKELETFLADRKAALLSGDVNRLSELMDKYSPGYKFPSLEVAELSMHKARTAARDLPIEARRQSRDWLLQRGYQHLGGKELDEA